jgi:branched-chain amino acid transport system ATP-binding protein
MLAIARALMGRPTLLLLDEPSLGLAPKLVGEVMQTLAQLQQEGLTILLVEQNAQAALEIADRGYVLEAGQLTLQGAAADLLSNPSLRAAYLGER